MLTFNGTDMVAFFGQMNGRDVFFVNDIGGRDPMSQEVKRQSIPGRAGSHYQSRRKPERIMPVRITLLGSSLADMRAKVDDLNAILNVDESRVHCIF